MCIKMYILAKSSVRQFCSWEYSTNFMNPWSRTLVDTEKHLVQHLFCVQWSTTLGFSSEVPGLPFLDVDPKPDIISFHQKSAQSILPLFVKFQKVVVPWKIGKLGGQLAPSLRSTTQAILLCHSDVARNSVAYPKCYLVTMDTTRFQWSNEQNWIRKKKSRVFLFPSDHNQLHTFPNPKKKKLHKIQDQPWGYSPTLSYSYIRNTRSFHLLLRHWVPLAILRGSVTKSRSICSSLKVKGCAKPRWRGSLRKQPPIRMTTFKKIIHLLGDY